MTRKLILVAIFLTLITACGVSQSTPEPDRVATRVAEEKAIAATLTADAAQALAALSANTPQPLPTATPIPPTDEPTSTPTRPLIEVPAPAPGERIVFTDTPTPIPTATPVPPTDTPTPEPTRPLLVVVPVDGNDGVPNLRGSVDTNEGRNITLPGYPADGPTDPPVFTDRIVFRAEVFDTNKGWQDGDGIKNVNFKVSYEDEGRQVHERTENNAGYCVFGGGEPECNVWVFSQHNRQWPDGTKVNSGEYLAAITINPLDGPGTVWRWRFRIELTN